jgi:plastocyanin
MKETRALAVAVCVMCAASACGGGGGYGGSTPTSATPTPTPGATTITISITGVHGKQSFSPNPASVMSGQQVIFKNNDAVAHRVVIDDRSIDTGDIPPGGSSQALSLGGVNKAYHCSVHPSMVGSLNAADTPEPPPCTGYCG